ncbi:MAG: hypothetical protein WD225_01230 [Ilumatobacteraceae bacterium]
MEQRDDVDTALLDAIRDARNADRSWTEIRLFERFRGWVVDHPRVLGVDCKIVTTVTADHNKGVWATLAAVTTNATVGELLEPWLEFFYGGRWLYESYPLLAVRRRHR